MTNTNSRIGRLQELLKLEEQRAALQNQIESITESMHSLRDALFQEEQHSGASSRSTATASLLARGGASAPAPKPATPAKSVQSGQSGRKARMKRGALKDKIMTALHAAGDAGIRVTELAKEFAMNPVNIHSWFHSALDRHPEIKKIQGGHYRLQGGGSRPSAASKNGNGTGARSASTQKPGKAAQASKGAGRGAGQSGNRRGELSARILSELQSAGAKGINVRELASKMGAPYKNIYIWFATTGKKNKSVKKLGPAHYKLS